MNSFDRKEVLFLSKDVPIFHQFNFPELAAFKSFFWMKTILQYPSFNKSLFVANDFMESLKQKCSRIIEEYNKIPSQEIWNIESINSTIRQIEYYKDTRVFASAQDIINVYDCLHKTVDHIESQAELGYKFSINENPPVKKASYKFYINEFILGDNTYLVTLDGSKIVFLNHSVLNTITTKDVYFRDHIYEHFQNIIRKSTQISGVGEKERSRFFSNMREKIEHRKKAVNHY